MSERHIKMRGKTLREVFALAGFPVPDKYELRWNSRAGWIIRSWEHTGQPDAMFCHGPKSVQRVIARGWVVPQYSIPLEFDEIMAHLAAPENVFDTLPAEVRAAFGETKV